MSLKKLIVILAVVSTSKINNVCTAEFPEIFTTSTPFSLPVSIKNNETLIHEVHNGRTAKIFCQASYPIFWSVNFLRIQQPTIHHQILENFENTRIYRVILELNGLTPFNRGYISCRSKKEPGVKSEFYFYVPADQPTLIHDRKTEVVYANSDTQTVTLPCLTDSPLGRRNDVRLLLFHEGLLVESAKYNDRQGFQVDIQALKRLKSNFKFECRLFQSGQRAAAGNPNYKIFFVVLKQVSVSPATTAVFIDSTPSSASTAFKCQDTSKQAGSLDITLLRNNGSSTNTQILKPGRGTSAPSVAEVALKTTGEDVNLICIRKSNDDGDGPKEILHQWRIIFKRPAEQSKELELSVSSGSDAILCYSKGPNAKPPVLQNFACSTADECAEVSRTKTSNSRNISDGCTSNLELLTWTEIKPERGSVCSGCFRLPIGNCDCLQHNATKPGLYRCQLQTSKDDGDLLYLPIEERQCNKKLAFAQPMFKPLFRGINSCSRSQNSNFKSDEGLYWDGRCGIPFQSNATHVLKCVGRRGMFAKNIRITTRPAKLPSEWKNVSHWTEDDPEHGFTSAMTSFTFPASENFSDTSLLVKCEAPLATEQGERTIETFVEVARPFRSPGFYRSEECSTSMDFVPDCPADNSSIIVKSCNADTFCNISCSSSINAFPRPQYQWFRASKIEHACSKNFSELRRDPILELVEDRVEFLKFHPSQVGIYICVGRIQVPSDSTQESPSTSDVDDDILCQATYFDVKENPYDGGDWRWKLGIGIIVPLFVVAMVFAVIYQIKFKNERHRANMLSRRDIHEFVHGNKEALNAEVDLSEQAHLLPYKNEYEFPFDKLKFGKLLGSGAYGIVYRAEALDIQQKGIETTVAVKTVVPDADLTYFKALLKELKVMIHIGSHLNVVNLLGACTNDLKNKKIFVIVEFCCFGNMQHYIQKYRRQFVDQIRDGKIVNVAAEEPTVAYTSLEFSQVNSDSSEAPLISLDTAGSTVSYSNIENTGDTSASQTGEADQPLWRTNIKGDFNTEEKIPLNTTTFVNWSYQVAKGMEYLASKKVFHGDLAARNVLLAEGGVVKVADFGLARQVYQDANYIKQERCPLPLKWMALESLLRMEFSSKSDVWAFGVLLWEIFTLGQVPYAGEQIDATFVTKLGEGHRLGAPQYATEDIYKMMARCWEAEPLDRPDFTALTDFFLKILQNSDFQGYERLSALESQTRARKVSHAYENVPK